MIQPDHPDAVDRAAVPAGVDRPFDGLSCAAWRERGEPRTDGRDRSSVPGDAVLRCAADDVAPACCRACGKHQAGAPPDAADGIDADLPAAANQHSGQGPQDLSRICCAASAIDRPNQVWCADITYIPMATRLPVSGGDHGLVQPQGAGVASVEHHGRAASASLRWMRRWPAMADRRSSTPTRAASSPVVAFTRRLEGGRSAHLDGWPRPLPGQHLHRASVALDQIRRGASACLSDGREARAGIGAWMTFYNPVS